jgi:hypothetical protein
MSLVSLNLLISLINIVVMGVVLIGAFLRTWELEKLKERVGKVEVAHRQWVETLRKEPEV